jgi:hypothetical protein
MDAVTLLRHQLTGVHGMFRDVVGEITPSEWLARAHPGGNPVGFLAWHIVAARDWAVHTWCQGVEEVRASAAVGRRPGVNPPYPPFGMSAEEAEAIARDVSREDVLAYADAVQEAAIRFLDTLADADLDATNEATRTFGTRLAIYQFPGYLEEVSDMYDFPLWRTLAGPAFGHVRGHLGEIMSVLETVRAG